MVFGLGVFLLESNLENPLAVSGVSALRKNLFCCLLFSATLLICPHVGAQPLSFDFVAEAHVGGKPESVIGDQNFLYASNMGSGANPFAKDGNGFISKLAYDGTIVDRNFISLPGALDAPTGMAFVGNQLFVADLDEIVGFDLDGQATPNRIDLRSFGVSFLNDLVAVSDRHLVVSGTNAKKLLLLDTVAQSTVELQLDFTLNHPNGLEFDQQTGQLYVATNIQHTIGANASNGEVLKLDLDVAGDSASFVSKAANAGLFLDGIALLNDDQLIYSDWVSFDRTTGVLGRAHADDLTLAEPTDLSLKGFADFHWQEERRLLAAPNFVDGRIRLLRLPVPEPTTSCLLLGTLLFGGCLARRWA